MVLQSGNASDLPPASSQVNKSDDWESALYESVIYDRNDDRNRLLELLLSDDCRERDVSVVRIVGAGGVGKTTFVHVLLYNSSTICRVFDTRAWVCANERFDVKGLTKQVIESLAGISCSLTELTEIQEALAEELMGKRFLLVLDNICNDDVNFWSSLLIPLSAGAKGSIVLATTQNESEALTMDMVNSYKLNRLPESNCWLVFHQHVFGGENNNVHPELIEIGKQIITRCEGLPLIVNAIGGLLQSDLNENFWQAVLESDLWCAGNNLPALRYFYDHLTVHLQQCFQYCSLFPKGYVFEKEHLVRLWMSQGFIKHEEGKHDQDTGIEYFDELLKRSFFQHSPVCGPIEKKYVMHDLFHDLAQSVSAIKCFRAETCELPNIAEGICHISLVPDGFDTTLKFETFKECRNIDTFLLINRSNMTWDESSFYIENPSILNDLFFHLRHLKTLDLSFTNIQVVPESIANLQQLCYLALNKTNIRWLPDSMCSLFNLQTLELRGCTYLSELPACMKNLTDLQHLDVRKECGFVFIPHGIGQLTSLQTLPAFMVVRDLQRHSGIRELKHLINLRGSLCIGGLGNVTNGEEAKEARLRMMKHLRSLVLHWCGGDLKSDRSAEIAYEVLQNLQPYSGLEELALRDYFGYQFPEWIADPSFPKLISLTLDNCCGCGILPQLGQLPSLKYLSIRKMDGVKHVDRQFIGSGTLRGFRSLETLKLWEMSELVEWFGVEDVDFPCLRSISISRCNKLRNLPSFTSLVELSIHCCAQLPDIPALPCLKSLKIEGFQNLESLPQQLNLPALKVLEISNCYRLMSLGALSHTASMKLKVTRCPKLNCSPKSVASLNAPSLGHRDSR